MDIIMDGHYTRRILAYIQKFKNEVKVMNHSDQMNQSNHSDQMN